MKEGLPIVVIYGRQRRSDDPPHYVFADRPPVPFRPRLFAANDPNTKHEK